jgi:hypothetical protein
MKNTSKCLLPGALPTLDRYLQTAHIPSQYLFSLSLRHLYEWFFSGEMKLFLEAGYREYFVGAAARPVIKIWTMRSNHR